MSLQDISRQRTMLDRLVEYVESSVDLGAMVVVGSFAQATADAVSDLDLLFIAYEGRFEQAWKHRKQLHVTGSIVDWDEEPAEARPVRGHRWITPGLVVVECVISAPRGGGRLAEPFELLVGDPEFVEHYPRRPPIDRMEMTEEHPVDIAYDGFKKAVRAHHAERG